VTEITKTDTRNSY